MKKLYLTLLILSILAFLGLTGFAIVKLEFNFVSVLQPFLSLFNAPIQFTLGVIEAETFTELEVLVLGGFMATATVLGLISFIIKVSKRRLMAGLTSLILTVLSAYLIVAMIVPHFSVLNDGVGINRYAYYLGDIISTGTFDSALFYTILDNGSFIPLVALDILLLLTLHSVFSRGSKVKVVKKVKLTKVLDTKKVVAAAPAAQPAPVQPAVIPPVATATDATLTELVKLVMAEEVKALKGPGAYGSTSNQVDAALVRRIVAEELSRFQVHFISRAEVQTILAQEIALLKLSLNIK
jgi:hypothetical protein